MKKRTKKAAGQTAGVVLLLVAALITVSLVNSGKPEQQQQQSKPVISKEVWDYQPLIEKYAETYHVEDYIDVLLGMMMQESGGRGSDPMQSSESYCGEVGCIDDPEISIKQGVYYFAQTIDAADGDVALAVQSYNFGKGFINYVRDTSGTYSQEAAIDFSREMYDKDRETYTCYRPEAEAYDACYGDIFYVRDVMAYRDVVKES